MKLLLAAASVAAAVADINLITFDGSPTTTYKFNELNDPVMGGKSTGTFKVAQSDGFSYGVFEGEVVNVPALAAPGFIKAAALGTFPDTSSLAGGDLVLTVRSATPDYAGFRVTMYSGSGSGSYACSGGGSLPLSRGCFKSKFSIPAGNDFINVRVPFSSFSDLWSPATGEQTSTCAEDPTACVTASSLSEIKSFEVWAEGVAGKVQVEILAISAAPKASLSSSARFGVKDSGVRPQGGNDMCAGAIQDNLLYGVSGRTEATVPVTVDEGESLAEAVCCDKRMLPFAEPQFLYEAPDIALFDAMKTDGETIFYDSVCGLPLFRTPVGRTLEEFKEDTVEHGWPSFRTAEVYFENVITDKVTGYVTSKCGTHLGSYLPDEKGDRWCIDLACAAGTAAP